MDYSDYRFGQPIPEDKQGLNWQNVDSLRNSFGSNTRFNQLQNHPNNTVNIPLGDMGGGYDTEDYIERLTNGRPNNIMDMDALMVLGRRGSNPTMDDYINQMENENSAAWQYSGGGRTEPLMPNVRQGGNVLYELLQSVFNDRGNDLSQWGREQSIRDTLARDGIY